jgi:hypothetical protein
LKETGHLFPRHSVAQLVRDGETPLKGLDGLVLPSRVQEGLTE